jgi:hypothetical protein
MGAEIGMLIVETIAKIFGTMLLVATSLQLGYVGGSLLQSDTYTKGAADRGRGSVPISTNELRSRGGASGRFETSKRLRQA